SSVRLLPTVRGPDRSREYVPPSRPETARSQPRRDRSASPWRLRSDFLEQHATRPPRGQLRVTLIPQYRRAPGYFRQPEASPLVPSRDDRARRLWPRAASSLPEESRGFVWSWSSLLIPYIDDVNINLTDVALAGRCIFTLSIFGSAIQTRGSLGRLRASNIAIADSAIPVPPTPRTGFARGRFFTSKNRPPRFPVDGG